MLSDPLMLVLLGVLAIGGSLVLVGGRRGWVLAALVAARSLTDIGASNGGSLLPSSTLSAALSGALVVLCLLPTAQRLSPRLVIAITFSILGLAAWTIIAWLHFGTTLGSAREALRLASYIAVLVVAYRAAQDRPERFTAFLATATLVPGVLLIGAYVVGWAPTLNAAGRAVGSFSHANSAAAFFGIAAIACLAEFVRTRRRLIGLATLVAVAALFLTQSLGNIIGVGFAVVVLLLFNSHMRLDRRVFLTGASVLVALLLFNVLGASSRLTELEGLDLERAIQSGASANSFEWRIINWRTLLAMWWEQTPVTGFGLGTSSSQVTPLGAPPHSLPVQIAVETGIAGLALVVCLAIALLAAIRRRSREHRLQMATLIALGGFALLSGSTSNLIGYTAAGYLCFFVFGFQLGATRTAPGHRSGSAGVGVKRQKARIA